MKWKAICAVGALAVMGLLFMSPAVPGQENPETEIVYLSGTGPDDGVEWDFFCTAGRQSGMWTTIKVPSCWEQQGFGAYTYGVNFYGKVSDPGISAEQGMYKTRFDVPARWQGRRVKIVFDGVMTDARVLVNGQKAGPLHQGGFYRFSYDISNLVRFGEKNLLEVTVSKESENASVNLAERRGDYWNFGGIFRPVFLTSFPPHYIGRVALDAQADGRFRAEVFTGEALDDGFSVSAQINDMQGNTIVETFEELIPRGSDRVVLTAHPAHVRTWNAETPHLYRVTFALKREGKTIHTVTERFGFRTFEIRKGDGFYLNGQRILLKGVNRHTFRPESGRTLSREQNYADVRLIREMNMNTVRMSHYPPDVTFLDACDELGLYVLDELAGWHGKYDAGVGRKLVEEMVVRDVNHPSILFWDNGNEGGWNEELDDEFACWDPQKRPVLHPQQDLNGVETMHYRSYGETQEYLRGRDIFFPTEILHGLYDGGLGAGLHDYWEMMRTHPRCGGGLLWVFSDEGVVRTDQGGRIDNDGNHGADGIVGPHHEKEGSFFAIKEIWSPVVLLNKSDSVPAHGEFLVENRYDFVNLRECSFVWKAARFRAPGDEEAGHTLVAEGSMEGPDVPPHGKGILKMDMKGMPAGADVLYLTALDPGDCELWTWSWLLSGDKRIPADRKRIAPDILETEDEVVVRRGGREIHFSRKTGELSHIAEGAKVLSFGNGPRFVAFRRSDRHPDGWVDTEAPTGVDRTYRDISGESRLTRFHATKEMENVVVAADYSGVLNRVRWIIAPDGTLQLDYSYRYDGVVELMGITFQYPEEKVISKKWLGAGPYRVWQNRLQGTCSDVWENQYNDPVPGETFVYPEFKGYFGPWRWVQLETTEGRILMATEKEDSYFGIFTPRDGRDALLYTFPETAVSVLEVIPAVRNKVNTTDLVGPSSRAQHVSGVQSGTLRFHFNLH